jgi:RNA polymerase sigma factor (sigma-70 family)
VQRARGRADAHVVTTPAAWIESAQLERLYRQAKADRWRLPRIAFAHALGNSCAKAFSGEMPAPRELSRYIQSLHLEDLALACACAEGHAAAWDHFMLEMRPTLYRASDALDASGGARDLADSLYGDLYGVDDRGGAKQSLLRYFHGRSSLATWLRAVLAQRYIDRVRAARRVTDLPDDIPATEPFDNRADSECAAFVERLRSALEEVIGRLEPRERLRLRCYYAEQLTLAQTGRLLKEHEATVSRQLARTRKAIRTEVETALRQQGMNDAQVSRCFECATLDPGHLDLAEVLSARKENSPGRSSSI